MLLLATMLTLDVLDYRGSRNFIPPERWDELPPGEFTFSLRHALKPLDGGSRPGKFAGVYVLQDRPTGPAVPVVYVFSVASDSRARELHKLVWNQNQAPFLLVESPTSIRLYSGFAYDRDSDLPLRSIAADSARLLESFDALRAAAIDDGRVWKAWGDKVDPGRRVDESLLRDLKLLADELLGQGLSQHAAHGLIGKFVYLRYLRDRKILSERKLEKWGLEPASVFGRSATLKAFRKVNDELQAWLNGSVFSLGEQALAQITQSQFRLVAGVFSGDSPRAGGVQLHLDFEPYDFSSIPIETLSYVYEQLLHAPDESGRSRGAALGAYYTPLPLADYLISEMEQKHPLKPGTRVLDPACGSGVFLVQCYRRLVESRLRAEGRPLKGSELRALLTEHIFGVDRDEDACRVTELSLILTLLDYLSPPDLESPTSIKLLPVLRDRNIFRDDFFSTVGTGVGGLPGIHFDWVLGNPPWKEVTGKPERNHEHWPVWEWMVDHKKTHPTGGNQIAEAFLWKAADHLSSKGVAGFVMPAMTWFKKESCAFRRRFFAAHEAWCLANFANLAYVLFAGRSESPASVVFYRAGPPAEDHAIVTFAPFVAEQRANRPRSKRRLTTWNIVVNGSEVREVPNSAARSGESLPWKLAMWGTARDARLLTRVGKRVTAFGEFAKEHGLVAHQGLELREAPGTPRDKDDEAVEAHPELVGKWRLVPQRMRGVGRIFTFDSAHLEKIPAHEAFIREGRVALPIRVSTPPHIIVDASRRFAVFSDEFIAVPPRQIGIAGPPGSEMLLRALSIYLSSDFCIYHQFLYSPKWGIDQNLADLDTLRHIPFALSDLNHGNLREWADLQIELARTHADDLFHHVETRGLAAMIADLNQRVFKLLGLRPAERWLVEDFVQVNLELNKGKVTEEATRVPTPEEVQLYLTTLRDVLDAFVTTSRDIRHQLELLHDQESALLSVGLVRSSTPRSPVVHAAERDAVALTRVRERMRRRHSQWLYFDRSLRVYEHGVLYQLKPLQRLHWTRRQAVLDADDIIAESLAEGATA